MKTTFTSLALGLLLLSAPPASAIDPLSASALRDICADAADEPDTADAKLCVFYVKGFLDGAVATDARVAENVAAEITEKESFSERAIRTRVIDRLNRYGPSVYAEFCVGQPDPIADVVLHVIEELDRFDSLDGINAQTVVYDSLRRHYRCRVEE